MPRGAFFIQYCSFAINPILVTAADRVALPTPAGFHLVVVGDETVSAVGQQPPALDSSAPPVTKPGCNLALTLIRTGPPASCTRDLAT